MLRVCRTSAVACQQNFVALPERIDEHLADLCNRSHGLAGVEQGLLDGDRRFDQGFDALLAFFVLRHPPSVTVHRASVPSAFFAAHSGYYKSQSILDLNQS